MEHRSGGILVGERHVPVLDPVVERAHRPRALRFADLGFGIQNAEDPLAGRERGLDVLVELGEVLDRARELERRHQEHEEGLGSQRAGDQDHASADPQDQDHGPGQEQLRERRSHERVLLRAHDVAEVAAIVAPEPLALVALRAERLDDADPGDVLLQRARHVPELPQPLAVDAPELAGDRDDDPRDRRENGHGDERQPPGNGDQDGQRDDGLEQVLARLVEPGRDRVLQHVDVVRHDRHQVPRARPLIPPEREVLEVLEDLLAQIPQRALEYDLRQELLEVPEHRLHEVDPEDQQAHVAERPHRGGLGEPGPEVVLEEVLGALEEAGVGGQRPGRLRRAAEQDLQERHQDHDREAVDDREGDHQAKRDRQQARVRPQVAE